MRLRLIAVIVGSALGCTGTIQSPGDMGGVPEGNSPPVNGPRAGGAGTTGAGGTPGGTGPGAVTGPGGAPVLDQPGPRPLRRLSRDELNNTLRDLLGDTTSPANPLPADSRGETGFIDTGSLSTVEVNYLLEMVERVAQTAGAKLTGLVACDPAAMGQAVCAQKFIENFGRRAFRRPLDPGEVTELVMHFTTVTTMPKVAFADGIRMVMQAMLLSPRFLYHWEVGGDPAKVQNGLIPLSASETASRLSYFLWATMPDDALFTAVDTGKLTTPADVERETRRMLADPRARQSLAAFHTQWLGLDQLGQVSKDTKLFPMFNSALVISMMNEVSDFTSHAILDDGGSLKSLLSSPSTTVDLPLAKVYGMAAAGPATLDGTQRAGLFTRAAFLAVNASPIASHPVKRGVRIYRGLLCGNLPPPPEVVVPPAAPPPGVSTREQYAMHGQNACAQGCHSLFDGLGFAFEHYDAIGRYRADDGGKPVDASGAVKPPSGGAALPFQDAIQMMGLLATAPDTRDCVSRQWMRFALGRREVDGDGASLAGALGGFKVGDGDIRGLIVALAKSHSFLNRSPSTGEVVR